jgi:hypothetical protein
MPVLIMFAFSSGGISPQARVQVEPGYQVPFAQTIRRDGKITVQAVGMIADPHQAEAIIAEGRADCVPRVPRRPALELACGRCARRRYCLPAAVRAQPAEPVAGRRASPPASRGWALTKMAITWLLDQPRTLRIAHAAAVEPNAMVANAAVQPIAPPAPPNRSSAMPTATGPAKAAV